MSKGGWKKEKAQPNQRAVTAKVSLDEKRRVTEACNSLGCSEGELIRAALFGEKHNESPLAGVARAHLSICHAIRNMMKAITVVQGPKQLAPIGDLIDCLDQLEATARHFIVLSAQQRKS